MSNKQPVQPPESLNIGDIYFVLFKRKWIVLTGAVLGVVAAVAILIQKPSLYESDAKLYVQFISDGKFTTVGTGTDPSIKQTDTSGDSIILTELEFLNSLDLAQQVASTIGPEKILAAYGGGSDTNAAAAVILKNLVAEPALRTPTIINISFQHPDGNIACLVLANIISAYIIRSAEEHRTVATSPEYLTNNTELLRAQLESTESNLAVAYREAGVISTLEATKEEWNNKYDKIQYELLDDGIRLAGTLPSSSPAPTNASINALAITNLSAPIPQEVRDDYARDRALFLKTSADYNDAILKYADSSPLLKDAKTTMEHYRTLKTGIEKQYPDIVNLDIPVTSLAGIQGTPLPAGIDPQQERLALERQTNYLAGQLAEIARAQTNLEAKESHINELQDRKKIEEAALNSFITSLEQSKVGGDQYSGGIKTDESPTPAAKKLPKIVKKLVPMALAGGLFGGIGLAFLLELVIDRTVKRPNEVEKKLRLPLFISIPDTNQNGHGRALALAANNRLLLKETNGDALVRTTNGSGANGAAELEPWDRRHPLHRFYSGLRDRIIVNFEVRNLNHNPKLVGVTSCGKGAGVSTVAAGLAASLSESGDGNVLLVDMRAEQGAAQHFHKGKPGCGLDTALEGETKDEARVQDHLYVASEGELGDDELPSALSKRFAKLMPKLKASDYDYIVFDMPPVSQTSMTPRLAGLMDLVLLVIESEKTQRDSVQRATALLQESRAQVSTVLNKVKTYVPSRLHQEVLDDDV